MDFVAAPGSRALGSRRGVALFADVTIVSLHTQRGLARPTGKECPWDGVKSAGKSWDGRRDLSTLFGDPGSLVPGGAPKDFVSLGGGDPIFSDGLSMHFFVDGGTLAAGRWPKLCPRLAKRRPKFPKEKQRTSVFVKEAVSQR